MIELLEKIKTSPHKGTFKAKVLDSKKPRQVLGVYNISPHKKLTLTITHISTAIVYQPLDEKLSLETTLNPNRPTIPRNTQIVFFFKRIERVAPAPNAFFKRAHAKTTKQTPFIATTFSKLFLPRAQTRL